VDFSLLVKTRRNLVVFGLNLKPLADARGSETQSADTEPRP